MQTDKAIATSWQKETVRLSWPSISLKHATTPDSLTEEGPHVCATHTQRKPYLLAGYCSHLPLSSHHFVYEGDNKYHLPKTVVHVVPSTCLDHVEQVTRCWYRNASSVGHAHWLSNLQTGAVHVWVQGRESVLTETIHSPQLPAAVPVLDNDSLVAVCGGGSRRAQVLRVLFCSQHWTCCDRLLM